MKSLITSSQSKRLVELEKRIDRHKNSFLEIGSALTEIRESKLYTGEYSTFTDYCLGKWGWGRNYCNKLIKGAEAVKSLPESVGTIVLTETQAREVAAVEPKQREGVVQAAAAKAEAESRPMTAADIKDAATEIAVEVVEAEAVQSKGIDAKTLRPIWGRACTALEQIDPDQAEIKAKTVSATAEELAHCIKLLRKLAKSAA